MAKQTATAEDYQRFDITPRERKNGTVGWRLRWYDNDSGKRESTTLETHEGAVQLALRIEGNSGKGLALLRAAAAPVIALPKAPDPADRGGWTLDDLYYWFVENKVEGSQRHRDDYRRDYRTHISPVLGHLVVADITSAHVQQWLDDIAKKTTRIPAGRTKPLLAASSVNKYLTEHLRRVARFAIQLGSKNAEERIRPDVFTDGVRGLDETPSNNEKFYTAEEIAIVCECAYRLAWWWGDFLSVMLAGGFRYSEVAPLKPAAAVPALQSVFVREVRRIVRNKDTEKNHIEVVPDAKSEAGFSREVPIASPVWKAIVQPALDRGGDGRHDLLVPGPSGIMLPYSTAHKYWTRTLTAAAKRGVTRDRITMRNLRDTMGTWYEDQGFEGGPLKKVMGHDFGNDVTQSVYLRKQLNIKQRAEALAAADLLFVHWSRG